MKLKSQNDHQLWIRFSDGRQIQLATDASVEIADSGLLIIRHSDYLVNIYPPNAWTQIKLVDPIGLAASTLCATELTSLVPDP